MSMLLASKNPEAAESFGKAPAGTPGVGEWVVFHPRPGERRQGRTSFPALVMWQYEDGALDLLIVYDANDVIMRQRIRKATDAEPFNVYALVDHKREVEAFEPSRLNAMTRDLAWLRMKFMGPHDNEFVLPEGQSIMAVLDGFGRRITQLERGGAASAKVAAPKKGRGK